ncbi:MAG: hypothetical protein EBS62_12930, partial [Betaproteobacteria bacterium]|nr:hypothetical protein [Betaproteobacteria bacterium]
DPQAPEIKLRPWSILQQALVDDLEALQPPTWLWWRIRLHLLLTNNPSLTALQAWCHSHAWLHRLVGSTALCSLGLLWIAFSAHMMTSVRPIELTQLLNHPIAWSTTSLHAQAGKPNTMPSSSALGAESLAILGVPFFGSIQSLNDLSATRQAQWITNHNGQILALRLHD